MSPAVVGFAVAALYAGKGEEVICAKPSPRPKFWRTCAGAGLFSARWLQIRGNHMSTLQISFAAPRMPFALPRSVVTPAMFRAAKRLVQQQRAYAGQGCFGGDFGMLLGCY